MDNEYRMAPVEANSEWEAGNAELTASRLDYERASHNHAEDDSAPSQANSDLGNLGH